jgi:hypothetical protein
MINVVLSVVWFAVFKGAFLRLFDHRKMKTF